MSKPKLYDGPTLQNVIWQAMLEEMPAVPAEEARRVAKADPLRAGPGPDLKRPGAAKRRRIPYHATAAAKTARNLGPANNPSCWGGSQPSDSTAPHPTYPQVVAWKPGTFKRPKYWTTAPLSEAEFTRRLVAAYVGGYYPDQVKRPLTKADKLFAREAAKKAKQAKVVGHSADDYEEK